MDRGLFTFLHPPVHGLPNISVVASHVTEFDNTAIAQRLIRAFRGHTSDQTTPTEVLWKSIELRHHSPFVQVLRSSDVKSLSAYLANIYSETVLHGIDQSIDQSEIIAASPDHMAAYGAHCMDRLARLAEALGCVGLENPEQGRWGEHLYANADDLLDAIQQRLCIDIRPPETGPGRYGLQTRFGLFNYRDINALYSSWRLKCLLDQFGGTSVCEIGAGMGKVAYYGVRMGIREYTIVDLPQVNAVQGFYLIRALEPNVRVKLYGEDLDAPVRILPHWLFSQLPDDRFDLIFNQDSMPEMGNETARQYVMTIRRKSRRLFLSVNHEAETEMTSGGNRQAVVSSLVADIGGYNRVYRFPFWLRAGYVEELYEVIKT